MFNSGLKNWTFHNLSISPSDGFILLISGSMTTMNIEITGDTTGATVIFEGKSIDGGDFYPIKHVVNLSTFELASSTSTIGSLWQVNLTGLISFRVRLSAIDDNSITVKGRIVESGHVLANSALVTISNSTIALPIDIQYNNLQDDNPIPVKLAGSGYHAIAFEQITISTLQILTSATYTNATQATIIVENAPIRYRIDSGTPTASVGMLANIEDVINLNSVEDIANFKAITTGANALISVTYSI